MDAVNIALQSAFILIFVVVLVRYLRDPRPVHRDLVLVFASVVALFAIAIVDPARGRASRAAVTQLSAVVLLLQPYLTLRLAGHFVPRLAVAVDRVPDLVRRGGRRDRDRDARQPADHALRRRATSSRSRRSRRSCSSGPRRHRVGYARTRLRIAAAATVCFAVGDPGVGCRSGGQRRRRGDGPGITAIARVLALVGRPRLPRRVPPAGRAPPAPAAGGRLRPRPELPRRRRSTATRTRSGSLSRTRPGRSRTDRPRSSRSATPPAVRIVDGSHRRRLQRRGAVRRSRRASDGTDASRRGDDLAPDRIRPGAAGLADRLPGCRLALPRGRPRPAHACSPARPRARPNAARRSASRASSRASSRTPVTSSSTPGRNSRARRGSGPRSRRTRGSSSSSSRTARSGYANGQALRSLGYSRRRDPRTVARRPARRGCRTAGRATSGVARRAAATGRPSRSTSRSAPSSRGRAVVDRGPDRHHRPARERPPARHVHRHPVARAADAGHRDLRRQPGPARARREARSRGLARAHHRHRGRGRTTPPADREPARPRPRRARRGARSAASRSSSSASCRRSSSASGRSGSGPTSRPSSRPGCRPCAATTATSARSSGTC